MKFYNFKQFTNAKGVEMLTVLTPGSMTDNIEEWMNIPQEERVKKLFTLEIVELIECDKEEIIEDYIFFEACIKDKEEQENLYNQMLNFKQQ